MNTCLANYCNLLPITKYKNLIMSPGDGFRKVIIRSLAKAYSWHFKTKWLLHNYFASYIFDSIIFVCASRSFCILFALVHKILNNFPRQHFSSETVYSQNRIVKEDALRTCRWLMRKRPSDAIFTYLRKDN